jgi:hypothetical protein
MCGVKEPSVPETPAGQGCLHLACQGTISKITERQKGLSEVRLSPCGLSVAVWTLDN